MDLLTAFKGCQVGLYSSVTPLLPLLLVLVAAVKISNGAALAEDMDPLLQDMEPLLQDMEPLLQDMEPLLQDMKPLVQDMDPLLHSVVMDPHGKYVMSWTPGPNDVIIEVQVETQGYVGLGFSPSGGMKGADIVMGWVDDEGETHLTDRYATGNGSPLVDDSQDVTLISGHRNDTHTTLRFRRPWDTCDKEHDMPITADTLRVIYAYNDEAPDPSATELPYHTARGTKSLYVKEPRIAIPEPGEDVQFWDVQASNISLPAHLTTLYWCKLFKVPKMEEKQHYIGFKPLIAEASLPFVHHMILYECHLPNTTEQMDKLLNIAGAQCYSPNMPLSWNFCNSLMVGWAIGSEGGALPDHVGIPLGEEFSGSTYFKLEIHYNNPEKIAGIVDSSGLRLMHTKKLRQHDGGFLDVGHSVNPMMVIGPHTKDWVTLGHCSSSCTEEVLPAEGIKVLGGTLHSHLLGTSMKVQHIRDGKEMPPILQDDHYDFNYQQERMLPHELTILPKDHLIINCHYDSRNKDQPTYGGLSTEEEMCLAFLMYYPRIPFLACHSVIDKTDFLKEMGVQEIYSNDGNKMSMNEIDAASMEAAQLQALTEQEDDPTRNTIDLKFYKTLNWIKVKEPLAFQNQTVLGLLQGSDLWEDGTVSARLQKLYQTGSYKQRCLMTGKKRNAQSGEGVFEVPPEYEPYQPEDKCPR